LNVYLKILPHFTQVINPSNVESTKNFHEQQGQRLL